MFTGAIKEFRKHWRSTTLTPLQTQISTPMFPPWSSLTAGSATSTPTSTPQLEMVTNTLIKRQFTLCCIKLLKLIKLLLLLLNRVSLENSSISRDYHYYFHCLTSKVTLWNLCMKPMEVAERLCFYLLENLFWNKFCSFFIVATESYFLCMILLI